MIPKEAALVADRMVSNKVVAVIGAYNSSATEPASVIYNRANILHITPSSTRVSLTDKGFKQFFRDCFLDDRQGLFAASFMKEVLGNKNIAHPARQLDLRAGPGGGDEEVRRAAGAEHRVLRCHQPEGPGLHPDP